ncbi:MAG: PEGA domain-containing protein, partial [Deltaproteobacteria bacterium]|nr:PEGA domain-containing protein [Deltaproteobacteria bacterium]
NPPPPHQAPIEATRRAARVEVEYPGFHDNNDDATIASPSSILRDDFGDAFMPAIPQNARFSPSLSEDAITGDDDDDVQRTQARDPFASHSRHLKRRGSAAPAIDIIDRAPPRMENPRLSGSDLHDNQETAFIRPRRDRTTSRLHPSDDSARDPLPQYGVIDAEGSSETTLDGDQENAQVPVLIASSLQPHPLRPKAAARGPRTELVRSSSPDAPIAHEDAQKTRQKRGHRVAMLVAAGILVALAVTIIAVIGLSGPDLEERAVTSPEERPGTPPTQPLSSKTEPLIRTHPSRKLRREGRSAKGKCAILVTSSPGAAVVFLDNHRQGLTPYTLKRLHEGHTYLVSVRLGHYTSWSTLLRLDKEKVRTLQARLLPQPKTSHIGYLVVHATPRANVQIDGRSIGHVTTEGRIPLSPGPHDVALKTPQGRRSQIFRVTIRREETLVLRKAF